MRALTFNIAFLDRMIDAIFVNQIVLQSHNQENSLDFGEERKENLAASPGPSSAEGILSNAFARELNKRIQEMDQKIQ